MPTTRKTAHQITREFHPDWVPPTWDVNNTPDFWVRRIQNLMNWMATR